jgi:polysaccharide biosynthesis transport protein
METNITISDIKGLIYRRAKLFTLLFSLVMLAAIITAITLPPIYKSQAVILIEAQQIPDEYVKSTITSYAEQRMEMTTREILRFNTLQDIIQEFDLYPEYRKHRGLGSAVQKMKDAIELEPVSSKVGTRSYTVAFNLSYECGDPQKTFAVLNRLSHLYLEKEAANREKQAAATTGLLESELAKLKQQIEKHEKKISAFKEKHFDELPGSTPANLANLQRLEREADQIKTRVRSLEDRKIYLKGQLADIEPLKPVQTSSGEMARNPRERLKTLRLELIRASSRLSPKHPDIIKMKNEIAQLEKQMGKTDTTMANVKRLSALRTELKEMRASKGDKHPDVIALSKQVNELAKQVDSLIGQNAITDFSREKPDNPAYINLMTQIVSADLEIKNLEQDLINTNQLIAEYERKAENAPNIEREFNELTLDYQNSKTRYNEVSGKLLQARVAQEMEVSQQGEHFAITDPAYLPTRPSKPNRLAIMLLGFVLATATGFGGAAFREATDHTIKSSRDLAQLEGIELLTAMPYTSTEEERRQRLHKKIAMGAGCLGILGVVLVAVDLLVLPLGDVFSIIIERLAF